MNNSKLSTILTILIAVICVIGAVLFIGVYLNQDADQGALYGSVSPLVEYSAWLLYISIAVTVVFSVLTLFKQPEDLKKIAINIAILGVIYVIAYATASGNAVLDVQGQILEGGDAGSTSKLVSTIINYATYLGVIAVAVVGLGAVKTAIK